MLTCILALLAAVSPSGRASLSIRSSAAVPTAVTVTMERVAPADGEERSLVVRNGALRDVELPAGDWRLRVTEPGLWHAEQYFFVDAGTTTDVAIEVWPRATMAGTARVASDAQPAEVLVRFESAVTGFAGEVHCPVAGSRFECAMPAGTFNVRLRPKQFVAHFRSELTLIAGDTRDLGVLEFREGQSITGHVVLPAKSGASFKDVRVTATPSGGEDTIRAATVAPEKNGFFHLDGLVPGEYVVRAALGRELVAAPVDVLVRQGSEAELRQPLRLEQPHRIQLALTPAVGFDGKPWHVRLSALAGAQRLEPLGQSNASVAGLWESRSLQPGRYEVVVGTLAGDDWFRDEIELGTADVQRPIELRRAQYSGTLSLGDHPLQARLSFSGSAGTVNTQSSEDGSFGITLPPVKDALHVSVESERPWVRRRVTMPIPKDGEPLVISLPDSVLMGTVVDGADHPVADAIVSMTRDDMADGLPQIISGADGSFEIHGVTAGRYRLIASGFLTESEPALLDITEGEIPDPIRLVIRNMSMLHGRVLSALGPVAAGTIHAVATDVPQIITETRPIDPNGQFASALPPGARGYEMAVAVPGFAFVVTGGALTERPVVVHVDQRGGSLTVRADDDAIPYIAHNGGTIAAGAIAHYWPAQRNSGEYLLPMMDPGSYDACLVDDDALFRRTAGQSGGRCVHGFLPPFGALTLDLTKGPQNPGQTPAPASAHR